MVIAAIYIDQGRNFHNGGESALKNTGNRTAVKKNMHNIPHTFLLFSSISQKTALYSI